MSTSTNYKVFTTFLEEGYDVLEPLTPAQRGEVYWALINYFLNGEEPTFDDALSKLAFNILKRSNERSFAKNKARSEAMKGNKNASKANNQPVATTPTEKQDINIDVKELY